MLLPVEDHHLRVADLGRGTPLLLHSGWVAAWDLWLPTIEVLQHDWRCIAYDHRGAGASTFPADAITAPALVDDVFRVLDALDVEHCVIAGESIGCLVVEQAVLRAPERFGGLVLVGGPTSGPPAADQRAAAVRRDWPGHVDRFVAACLPEADAGPLHRWGRGTLLAAGPEAAVTMTAAHDGVAPELERIAIPTLIIHGARDAIVPVEVAREAATRIPGARLAVLDDAGHVPILTRPRHVADTVNAWWAAVS